MSGHIPGTFSRYRHLLLSHVTQMLIEALRYLEFQDAGVGVGGRFVASTEF